MYETSELTIFCLFFQVEIDENSLGEQTLPNFYAEDINNCMNRERRREALAKFLRIIKADVDRETKGMYLIVYFYIFIFHRKF